MSLTPLAKPILTGSRKRNWPRLQASRHEGQRGSIGFQPVEDTRKMRMLK
jgi:hypothetical protein